MFPKNMPKKIRKFKFEKLARDEIVQGIIGAGNKPTLRTLMTDEYIEELKKKILEEAMELNKAKEKEEILEELADIEEVTENILRAFGLRKDITWKKSKWKMGMNGSTIIFQTPINILKLNNLASLVIFGRFSGKILA